MACNVCMSVISFNFPTPLVRARLVPECRTGGRFLGQPLQFRAVPGYSRATKSPMGAATMHNVDLDRCLEVAVRAAQNAGQVIKEAWSKPRTVHHKTSVDLVTETDKQCEALLYDELRTAFPDHAFIGEEGSAAQGFTADLTDVPTWMVDPVDGTTNFVHGYPFTCVSIGLAVDKELVLGVVFNPVLGELYRAVRGGGAFLNDTPIHVSDKDSLDKALFATELGIRRDEDFLDAAFERIKAVLRQSRSVRCGGSCALNLCSIAQGRLDAYFEYGLGGPWDMAAGAVILREAGGEVLDPSGAGPLVAASEPSRSDQGEAVMLLRGAGKVLNHFQNPQIKSMYAEFLQGGHLMS